MGAGASIYRAFDRPLPDRGVGVLVLVAIDGWGGLAARWMTNVPVDAGLRLAWGMAVLLAIGGALVAVGLATRPVVIGVVGLGLSLALLLPRWRDVARRYG